MILKGHNSPNQGARPAGVAPRLVVLHGTEGSDAGDLSWIMNPKANVSYHYLILRTGAIYQLVPEYRRAWHAGDSRWNGIPDVNDYSIGIGLSGKKAEGRFTDKQYQACGWLIADIMERRPQLVWRGIVGHYHVSPGRKQDPWEHFHWGRLVDEVAAAQWER